MHDSTRWIARAIVTLAVLLLPGWVSAAPPQAPPSRPIVIRAGVDQLEPDRLVIRGKHFGAKSTPIVLLANVPLEVLSFSDEQIVTRLPIDAPAASYDLRVLVNGMIPSRVFEVTVGREGRPGPKV
jgi:IPT/TIG domain-containing protein